MLDQALLNLAQRLRHDLYRELEAGTLKRIQIEPVLLVPLLNIRSMSEVITAPRKRGGNYVFHGVPIEIAAGLAGGYVLNAEHPGNNQRLT